MARRGEVDGTAELQMESITVRVVDEEGDPVEEGDDLLELMVDFSVGLFLQPQRLP